MCDISLQHLTNHKNIYNRENWNKHVKCHRWTEEEGADNLVLSGGKQSPPSPRPCHRTARDDAAAEVPADGKVVYQPGYRKARSYMTLPVVLPQQVKRISKFYLLCNIVLRTLIRLILNSMIAAHWRQLVAHVF